MKRLLYFLAAAGLTSAADDFPIVPEDVDVALFAQDPLVRNPCALAFDRQGRLCVGMGPQYRKPKPDTPGDSVWILLDDDGDGVADGRKMFATGLNAIQGMAWKGGALWVANAPDLTVLRDLDGDDVADEYLRLYTDLGNLEHGLHGLNWAPDGKLYMSKGNSKGLNRSPDRMAPEPFRDLWGVSSPVGTPDFPSPVRFESDTYQKNYHNPADDWGLCGGILRCDEDGGGLEIVSRGNRNPWDMAFDDGFDWLATDNDQNLGDKFFSPFFGAHFGWGHPWSYDWEGNDHWPSAPSSGPLFEGSGAGVIYLGLNRYPEKYRGVFLVNDWLNRKVYVYRPGWDGAWLKPQVAAGFDLLADAGSGRSMKLSDGRRFDPVDIELGPDGAVYISSWGREYGAKIEGGNFVNEGRIYRLWPKVAPPEKWADVRDPWRDLGSHLPVWRANAQQALVDEGMPVVGRLQSLATDPKSAKGLQTWAAWTAGRIGRHEVAIDDWLVSLLHSDSMNLRIQAVRILAFRSRLRDDRALRGDVVALLEDEHPRIRHAAVLALRQAGDPLHGDALVALAARESDRIVYYSVWGAMGALIDTEERRSLLGDERVGVRRAALLSLLEEDALDRDEVAALSTDPDKSIAALATRWLGGKSMAVIKGPALDAGAAAGAGGDLEAKPISVVSSIVAESGRSYSEATLRSGALSYTDRGYRFRSVPDELSGETFIRGANDDADAEDGTSLTVTLRYPSTVFLADDRRGKRLPKWAVGVFEPTPMSLHNGDARMSVFKAEMPAGQLTFGPNRQGVSGRKGNYIVIVRPRLLDPAGAPPTVEDVLPLMAHADAERGRALVLSRHGATCATCHQLEGIGNVFAPDLSEIGTRADAHFLIRSILRPSAEITEGFAMQIVTTRDGKSIGGIVLGETGRELIFGTVGGIRETVAKANIVKRETAPVSAMPELGALLSAQQVADIAAYLLGKKPSKPEPARAIKSWGDQAAGWHLQADDHRVSIRLDGVDVLSYFFKHEQTRRPFFAHVKTPSGIQVTRNFPPVKGVDPVDHAYMHPGLSLGFATLSGENFWHNDRGVVVHEGFVGEPAVTGKSARFSVGNRYQSEDGKLICRELASYELSRNQDGYLIRMQSEFTCDQAISFGVKEEMGLAVRVASPLRVKKGSGTIRSASGGRNEKGTWGKFDQWWDYFGPIGSRNVGIQVMTGTGNPEVWAHSRDYGLLVANPFPVDVKANRDLMVVLEPGDVFQLSFGIQIHDHADRRGFDPNAAYRRFLDQK